MSTRSIIAVQTGDTWKGRYCHSDGYPTHLLKALLELVARDGVEQVRKVLTEDHAGWSHLDPDRRDLTGVQFNPKAEYGTYEYGTAEYDAWSLQSTYGERCINVPGYGVAYNSNEIDWRGERYRQVSPDEWYSLDDEPETPWAYVLTDRDIVVYRGEERWVLSGRAGYDADPEDKDLLGRLECGEDFEHCEHYAWVHFPEAKESRVGTAVWLGREEPAFSQISAFINPRTGARWSAQGSGGMGTARDHDAWRDRSFLDSTAPRYWWSSVENEQGRRELRTARCLKAGYKLEYDGIVLTSAGEKLLAAGTVVR